MRVLTLTLLVRSGAERELSFIRALWRDRRRRAAADTLLTPACSNGTLRLASTPSTSPSGPLILSRRASRLRFPYLQR
jgi:hypothetical protein